MAVCISELGAMDRTGATVVVYVFKPGAKDGCYCFCLHFLAWCHVQVPL